MSWWWTGRSREVLFTEPEPEPQTEPGEREGREREGTGSEGEDTDAAAEAVAAARIARHSTVQVTFIILLTEQESLTQLSHSHTPHHRSSPHS